MRPVSASFALLLAAAGCEELPPPQVAEPVEAPRPLEPTETRVVEVTGHAIDDTLEYAKTARPGGGLDPAFFRLGAGYGALGHIDLAPCEGQGLTGYVRMSVTFRESGRVTRAAVESRVATPPDALACIAEQLKVATVPVFEGGEVTLSRTYYVGAGTAVGSDLGAPVSL
jgi:hypothetical protein